MDAHFLGYYAGVGLKARLAHTFIFGINVKHVFGADVDLVNAESIDHWQAVTFVGGAWGYPRPPKPPRRHYPQKPGTSP